ncbi:hypothetical protein [Dactylosporangium sp. NPDC051541]|uniref:lipase/acyltransferase domain-containing protein n=1 Tax=Dactylosporangium sp. NPDC051541 TaxID=3363977 RepID=UPI003790A126
MVDANRTPRTADAVIVVPGIMGSELVDAASGRMVWGLRDPRWYMDAWCRRGSLDVLHLSAEERGGRYGRIRATGLLRAPAFAPHLRGIEPYGRLVNALREAVLHPDAVLPYPYDWRLPVAYNAARLAEAGQLHLEAWRAHPSHPSPAAAAAARLVIVAHSMGGLVAAEAVRQSIGAEVRRVITLGTPFFGAVKVMAMLAGASGAPLPLPRRQLRALAATLPGVYNLLPTFRCVDMGDDARSLTPADVADIGGDAELAEAALRAREQPPSDTGGQFVQIVGTSQQTMQSLSVEMGVLSTHEYTCRPGEGGIERVNLAGDGTVHRQSAQLPGARALPLPQSHGAIAKTHEAITMVRDVLFEETTAPWLGDHEIGVSVPDLVASGEPLTIVISGVEHPRDVQCRVIDVTTERPIAAPAAASGGGTVTATTRVEAPGLYRVEAIGGGMSAVSEVVLVTPPADERSDG